jgi:DNA mismatch endonuclease Vsr
MDNHTPEQRKKNMRAVKNKNSKIEIMLRKTLWDKGVRYRKNDKTVFGHPDLSFKRKKVVVFCDSEFWHGYNWEERSADIKTRREFWIPKIERNIERDKEVNEKLASAGWTVIRFWGNQIKKNTEACAKDVISVLEGHYEICVGRIYRL